MLFSEPKISQLFVRSRNSDAPESFSALQRAENFSIHPRACREARRRSFQCSSASRKFLNFRDQPGTDIYRFVSVLFSEPKISQCNQLIIQAALGISFSALQRAENFSMSLGVERHQCTAPGFQCSSASRKFLNISTRSASTLRWSVSVLFSEPKISQ